jgi:hypothetical protein
VLQPTKRRASVAALAIGCVVACASGTGVTYAAFSDFQDLKNNHVAAAHVAVGIPGPSAGPELDFTGLLPGISQSKSFGISYLGSIPADIALEVRPEGTSAYCDKVGAETWVPKPGGSVQLSFGAVWLDYCGLLGAPAQVPVESGVTPGTNLTVQVSARLAPGTDYHYSALSHTDELTVVAHQTSAPGSGFTDFAVGTIEIGTGTIGPAVPAECGSAGKYNSLVLGTDGDDVIDAGNGKAVVLGLGGDDRILGANGKDCLVGGDGDDVLVGGNGKDVLVGGLGYDTCVGGRAPDVYSCEASSEQAVTSPQGQTVATPAQQDHPDQQSQDHPQQPSPAPTHAPPTPHPSQPPSPQPPAPTQAPQPPAPTQTPTQTPPTEQPSPDPGSPSDQASASASGGQ